MRVGRVFQKRSLLRIVLIIAMLASGCLGGRMQTASAADVQAELLHHFDIFNTDMNGQRGPMTVSSYFYSEDGSTVVRGAASLPPKVKWAAVERYYHPNYPTLSAGLRYMYCRNGVISSTSDAGQVPADATWVTISDFYMLDDPIFQQSYRYSVDGVSVQQGSTVPNDAVWATLAGFMEKYGSWPKNQYYQPYTADVNVLPKITNTQLSSTGSNPQFAKAGDQINLTFSASEQLQASPTVTINGKTAQVDASGDQITWTAHVPVDAGMAEGKVGFTINYTDLQGGVGTPVTASKDSSGKSVLIDKTSPVLSLTAAPQTPTNGDVTVTISTTETGSGVASLKWANGNQNAAYFSANGTALGGTTFAATANDTYTVFVQDKAGNTAVETIDVTNIDKVAPTITLSASPVGTTAGDVTVTATIADSGSGVIAKKWASGDQNAAYFAANGTSLTGTTFDVSANGTYTVYAKDAAGNETVQTIAIGNIDKNAPVISLSASPVGPTNSDVTITATITDDGTVAEKKWANGTQSAAYFATNGTTLTGSSFVTAVNGTYTVFAKDAAGNTAVKTITVSTIDKVAPSITLSAAPTGPTNGDVTITATITDNGSIAEQKWASGDQNAAYFAANGTSFTGTTFAVSANGTYTVFAKDAAGNTAVEKIPVSTIDKVAPAITLSAAPTGPTNGDVTITATITDNGSIAEQKWASGDQNAAYFAANGTSFTGTTFDVTTNGTYTVYAKDAAGNATVQTIAIGNIDKNAPAIVLDASPTDPTNGDVTITATITDNGSITEQKWASGDQNAAYFAANGTSLTGTTFDVTANGTYTVYAKDAAGNETVKTIAIGNIDKNAPSITLSAAPTGPTNGDVTITATITDNGSIAEQKWASGDQDAAYFAANGTSFTGTTFAVSANGMYTVFAKDAAGNTAVEKIPVSTIDKVAPAITLDASPTGPSNGDVTITATITDNGSIAEQKWASGDQDAAYFAANGTSLTGNTFTVDTNGTYTVYAKDDAGNESVETIAITNIDKDGPTIALVASPTQPTNSDVTITATITDNGNIAEQKWASGDQNAAYFAANGTSLTGNTFTVDANGTYTVYAKDDAGNESVKTIDITNIDKDGPTIALVASPTQPTNGDVTITATITDNGSIAEQKWASGDQNAAYFAANGTSLTGNTFTVDANGTYTVYAKDDAGNESVETINITNIDHEGPTITLAATPTQPTTGNVTIKVTFTAGLTDLAVKKWASGDRDKAYFAANGTALDGDSFRVVNNGMYTVYAKDLLGNEAVKTINVTNIQHLPAYYPVTGVSLDQTSLTMQENGDSITLHATVAPNYATNQQVRWTSSDEKVAAVDQNGVVTPLQAGAAIITARTVDGGFTAESKVTVEKIKLLSLELDDESILLKPNKSARFNVYAVYSDKTREEITRSKETQYEVDSSVVTVRSALIRAGKNEGEARVTISYGGLSRELLVVVGKKQLNELKLPAEQLQLESGETAQLKSLAIWSDEEEQDVSESAIWSSSDETVVEVEQGKLIAHEPGKATITVSYGDKKASIEVESMDARKVRRITADRSSLNLKEGTTRQLTLTATYTDGTKSAVTDKAEWTSADEAVAKVEQGMIEAVSPGTTTVTATYRGKSYKIKITVK
ncbi:beta strand repeat-containing protein [Brevibacillus fluminis]|uniref:beta strand repeat-containing protein n=1 Tax=Brevibacillus fluminis TaxID=511487 RepID=UPI003F8CF0F4